MNTTSRNISISEDTNVQSTLLESIIPSSNLELNEYNIY